MVTVHMRAMKGGENSSLCVTVIMKFNHLNAIMRSS